MTDDITDDPQLEDFLRRFDQDWIAAGAPGPHLVIAMVREIKRLRAEVENYQNQILEAGEYGQ